MMFTTFRSSLTECYSPLPVPVSGAFESQFHLNVTALFFKKPQTVLFSVFVQSSLVSGSVHQLSSLDR